MATCTSFCAARPGSEWTKTKEERFFDRRVRSKHGVVPKVFARARLPRGGRCGVFCPRFCAAFLPRLSSCACTEHSTDRFIRLSRCPFRAKFGVRGQCPAVLVPRNHQRISKLRPFREGQGAIEIYARENSRLDALPRRVQCLPSRRSDRQRSGLRSQPAHMSSRHEAGQRAPVAARMLARDKAR